MWSDFWSSRWPIWVRSIWVRLSLIVACVVALGYIFVLIYGSDVLSFLIFIVVLITVFIALLMTGFRTARNLLAERASRLKQRLDEITKDLKDHSAGDLEHFPKRMNRAGFPCGHESDSRIVLEGRPV
jgi:K+ transporter